MPCVYIKTFGCQMNGRDSEALAGLFRQEGYALAADAQEADIILVNTCSVRAHAEDRAVSFLGALKKHKAGKVIGLIGCMARARGEEISKKMRHIDLVCGPAVFDKIPAYTEEILDSPGKRIIDLEDRLRNEDFYRARFRQEKNHAYVVISTGCSNYCSYCIVPFTRGPLRLRKPEAILEEVKRNVDSGITKITLLGQNVNDYHWGGIDFLQLLRQVEKTSGLKELDFITSHPKNTSLELFEFMAASKIIKKHLHLPFQAGSNRILKMMNRGYTKEEYLELAANYKNATAGTLSTDVIVGFPSETEKDFLETKEVMEQAGFSSAYIFKYSPRPHSAAFAIKDDVPAAEKKRRHKLLLDLQKKISLNITK